MYRVSSFVPRFAKALLGGAGLATLWVNLSPASYYDSIEKRLIDLNLPGWMAPLPLSLTPLNVVADGLKPIPLMPHALSPPDIALYNVDGSDLLVERPTALATSVG